MHTVIRRSVLASFAALMLLTACGGSDPAAPDNYLPLISNFWRNVANPAHSLLLASTDDRKPAGVFTGKERLSPTDSSNVTGSFQNSKATVVISRSSGTVTYTGTFYGGDSLRLVRGNETLRFRILQ
jgi:hypothetical protein